MTAIKITQKKEGAWQPVEERVKLEKINRNRRGKIERNYGKPATKKNTGNSTGERCGEGKGLKGNRMMDKERSIMKGGRRANEMIARNRNRRGSKESLLETDNKRVISRQKET